MDFLELRPMTNNPDCNYYKLPYKISVALKPTDASKAEGTLTFLARKDVESIQDYR